MSTHILNAFKVVRLTMEPETYESLTSSYLPVRYKVGEWVGAPACMAAYGYGFLTGFLKLHDAQQFALSLVMPAHIVTMEGVLYQANIPLRIANLGALRDIAMGRKMTWVVPYLTEWPKGTNFFARVRVLREL